MPLATVEFVERALQNPVEIIGSGLEYSPFFPHFAFYFSSVTHWMYTPQELGVSGPVTINNISFYVDNAAPGGATGESTTGHTIRMLQTTSDEFPIAMSANVTASTDLQPLGGPFNQATVRTSFTFNVTAGYGKAWYPTITLTSPYSYDGVRNLIITWVHSGTGYEDFTPLYPRTLCYKDDKYRGWYDYEDVNPIPDTSTGTRTKLRPVVRIGTS